MFALKGKDKKLECVKTSNRDGASSIVLICEHASNLVPAEFDHLGLPPQARLSHAAWDPGAFEVAQGMSAHLDACLIFSGVSRLVYDCNRPPEAPDAMPSQSELIAIPGNVGLSGEERALRASLYYHPFRKAVSEVLSRKTTPVVVTIHSFTPIYHGKPRVVEIGVLHDSDTRLADAMLQTAPDHTDAVVLRNEPYGPEDGVTHTLKAHAIDAGYLNVMLEIRNDLIETKPQQDEMARMIAQWVADAYALTGGSEDV